MKFLEVFANAQRANRARRDSGGASPSANGSAPAAARQAAVAQSPAAVAQSPAAAHAPGASSAAAQADGSVDLMRRHDALAARVAELQWDLGGLVYEMATRDRIRVDVLVKRAAALQEADAELSEIERIMHLEQTGTAGACPSCGAPHSSGAAYCWQCGQAILSQVPSDAIAAPRTH